MSIMHNVLVFDAVSTSFVCTALTSDWHKRATDAIAGDYKVM